MSVSSTVNVFVHAFHKRLQKCLMQKVGHLGSLEPIPMIQPPFYSSCVVLHYEPGTKFPSSGSRVMRYQNKKVTIQPCGVSVCFLRVQEMSGDLC